MKKPQKSLTLLNPFSDASTLGNVLLRMQKITRDQLHYALGVQARTNEHLLGALLVEQGCLNQLDVAKALEIQHSMRTGGRATAELLLLDAAMDESAAVQADLGQAIDQRRAAVRGRGDDTGPFLAHPRRA